MSIVKKIDDKKVIFADKSVVDHNQLGNREAYGCHPISAIRKLPEKLYDLKETDKQLQSSIDSLSDEIAEIDLSGLKAEISAVDAKVDNVEDNAKKITISENEDSTFTFTDYEGTQKTIQSGFLPDDDTLQLSNNKMSLKKVYIDKTLLGDGVKDNKLAVNIDNSTIVTDESGRLVSSGLQDVEGVLTAQNIKTELSELNKDIGDLTDQLNSDVASLDEKTDLHNDQISDLLTRTRGLGGYINAYNFKKATPTQDELSNYALTQIPSITTKEQIFNQTKVKNLFDGNVWILTNTPDSVPAVFEWVNKGTDVISDANNDGLHGLVTGSYEELEGRIDVLGHITINGLEEKFTSITDSLPTVEILA